MASVTQIFQPVEPAGHRDGKLMEVRFMGVVRHHDFAVIRLPGLFWIYTGLRS